MKYVEVYIVDGENRKLISRTPLELLEASVSEKCEGFTPESLLKSLRCPMSFLGYKYISCALELALEGKVNIRSITKEVYPIVAKKMGTNDHRVERAIRYAVENIWVRADELTVKEIFGFSNKERDIRPGNMEFLAGLYEYLSKNKQAE